MCLHRDYIVLGSEVLIDMFDDRLEITSPGGLFGGDQFRNLIFTASGQYVVIL